MSAVHVSPPALVSPVMDLVDQRCGFLDILPPEVRLCIYELVTLDAKKVTLRGRKPRLGRTEADGSGEQEAGWSRDRDGTTPRALLSVCKLIAHEVRPLMPSISKIDITLKDFRPLDLEAWAKCLGPTRMVEVRKMTIEGTGRCADTREHSLFVQNWHSDMHSGDGPPTRFPVSWCRRNISFDFDKRDKTVRQNRSMRRSFNCHEVDVPLLPRGCVFVDTPTVKIDSRVLGTDTHHCRCAHVASATTPYFVYVLLETSGSNKALATLAALRSMLGFTSYDMGDSLDMCPEGCVPEACCAKHVADTAECIKVEDVLRAKEPKYRYMPRYRWEEKPACDSCIAKAESGGEGPVYRLDFVPF